MPADTKKVLWTVISVGLFLVVFFGTALLLFAPRKGSPQAPAAIGNEAPPRAAEPDEYLRNPVPAPAPASIQGSSPGDVVVVYGENPPPSALPGTAAPDGSAVPAAGSGNQAPAGPTETAALPPPAKSGSYKPAPAVPAAKSSSAIKPEGKAPTAKPKVFTVSEWWIQASSPTSRTRAESLQAELAEKGLSSVISMKDVDGTTHYRVRIGPYASEKEALGWKDRVRALPDCAEAYVSKTTVQRTM